MQYRPYIDPLLLFSSPVMKSLLISDIRSWLSDELAALALVAAALFSFVVIFNARKRAVRLPLPPGPWGLPLLGYLPFLRPDLHRCFFDLSRAYGPIMSLWLGAKLCVVISSPSGAREVLKDQDAAFANRDVTAAARAITYGGCDMVWSPLGPTWRLLRKVSVRELLNPRSLDALQPLRREAVRGMVGELRGHAGRPVEVRETLFVATLRLITRMLWGSSTASSSSLEDEFRQVMDEMVDLLGAPNVSDFFPLIGWMDLQGVERRMRSSAATLDRILSRIINQRLRLNDGGERSKDLLQAMLELVRNGEEDEERLSVENIKGLFIDLVAGGTDSTSTTTEWAMAELIKNPKLMRRAVNEIDAVVGSGNSGVVEESDLPQLRYIDAVVKEALRLHPTVPLLVPHCPSTDCAVGGYNIPKGTRVFINAWAIHRDMETWRDPLEFRPERFLEEEGGNWDYNGGNGFLPFGSGRRICTGIVLAERLLKYLLATLLHSFEWRLPEGVEGIDLSDKFAIVLKMEKPLAVVPVPRFSDPRIYE